MKALQEIRDDLAWWHKPGVALFVGDPVESGIFMQSFRNVMQKSLEQTLEVIWCPTTQKEFLSLNQAFCQSFLGTTKIYWLLVPPTLSVKLKKKLFDFLAAYEGPHTICLVIDEDEAAYLKKARSVRTVVLPKTIAGRELAACAMLLGNELAAKKAVHLKTVLAPYAFSLQIAYMVITHLAYVPLKIDGAVDDVLLRLIPYQGSLTTLADLFFKKNWQQFFMRWEKIYDSYSEMFWLSFWSDQAWRAYFAIEALSRNNTAGARRFAYRLPSSFLTRSWKLSTKKELYALYQSLYFFDIRAKNNTSFTVQDVLMSASRIGT